MPALPEVIATPVLAFCTAALLMPLLNRLAVKLGFVDVPNARKIHAVPIPLLGGVGVYAGVILTLLMRGSLDPRIICMMGASLLVMLLGVLDDRLDLHSRYRLILQVLLAAGLSVAGVRFHFFPLEILNHVITVLWIVGVINAMNCLDCADGASGSTCVVVFGALAWLAWSGGRFFVCQAALAGAGAVLGFLIYNLPPARVFLGDAGSTFLGLMAAALTILAVPQTEGSWNLTFAPILLVVPVLDIAWVHIRRYQAGIRSIRDLLSSTGKDHLPHRLMARGLSKQACMVVVALLTVLASLVAICLTAGLWIPAGMAAYLMGAILWHVEDGAKVTIRPGDQVAIFEARTDAMALAHKSQPEESVA